MAPEPHLNHITLYQHQCATSVQSTLSACGTLGIPMAFDKLEGLATRLTSLGITLDSTT